MIDFINNCNRLWSYENWSLQPPNTYNKQNAQIKQFQKLKDKVHKSVVDHLSRLTEREEDADKLTKILVDISELIDQIATHKAAS